jgi:23S rRNA (uracil1939-C5)-methyltransferase
LASQLAALPGVRGVHISVNPDRSSYMMGEDFVHVAGSRHMMFQLGGQSFRLSPGSFFQTSHEGAELLVKQVLDLMPEHMLYLADLYGGVGVFARASQKRWKRAVVAESNPHAAGDLKSWVHHTKTGALRVLEGRVEETIDAVLDREPDVLVVDPPRNGCHPRVLSAIARERPPVIIYVACGMEALVRDGAILKDAGYEIDRVNSVDMFPHTTHLEVVTRFVRREETS